MGWYNSSWTYRQKVIIDATKVDEIFQVFPIYTSKLGNDFWTNAKAGAADVRITQSDGTTEVARCCMTHTTGTKTGLILASVIADVSISVNSYYWVYYGNSAASDYSASATYGEQNTFSTYAGVYFPGMDTRDFTSGGRTLTGSVGTTTGAHEGITAATFNGSQVRYYDGTQAVTTWPVTLETLAYSTSSAANQVPVGYTTNSDSTSYGYIYFNGAGSDTIKAEFAGTSGSSSTATTSTTYSTSTTYHIAASRSGATGTSATTLNGGGTGTDSTTINTATFTRFNIGANRLNSGTYLYLSGGVEWVGISNSARSANYITTMYNAWSSSTFFAAAQVDIETLGYVYPATTGNIGNGGGSISWVNTANAVDESNTTAATCTVIDYEVTKFLALSNFGFSIPSDSTVAGIQVEVTHKADNTAYFNVSRGPWKLVSSAAVIGTDQSGGSAMTNVATRVVVGSESNLWGATLTPTIVNASDFGVGIAYVCNDVYSGSVISVYSVRMRLTYNAAVAGNGGFFAFFNSFGNVA